MRTEQLIEQFKRNLALIALFAISLHMGDAHAYSTISCGTGVNQINTVSWNHFNLGYVENKVEATAKLIRESCGREYRGDLKIKGSTAFNYGDAGPMAVIAKKASNACTLRAEDSAEGFGSLDSACGAWVEFSSSINGIVGTPAIVKQGCAAAPVPQFYYIYPNEVDVQTVYHDGCTFPPENNAISSIAIPDAPEANQICDGKWSLSWEAIPTATSYTVMTRELSTVGYVTHYTGPNRYLGPFRAIQVNYNSWTEVWVKACNATGCSYYSEPATLPYFSGCP